MKYKVLKQFWFSEYDKIVNKGDVIDVTEESLSLTLIRRELISEYKETKSKKKTKEKAS